MPRTGEKDYRVGEHGARCCSVDTLLFGRDKSVGQCIFRQFGGGVKVELFHEL